MEQNDFKQKADDAEMALKQVEESIGASMDGLRKEKYEELKEKLAEQKANEIADVFVKNIENLCTFISERDILSYTRSIFSPLIENFPPECGESIIKNLLLKFKDKEFKDKEFADIFQTRAQLISFALLSLFGENYGAARKKESDDDEDPVIPLTFTFQRKNFGVFAENVGAFLPKDCVVIFEGNAGKDIGRSMSGGTLIINGDTGGGTGRNMNDGTITVNGNTGFYTGEGMCEGMIQVNGDVGLYTARGMSGGTLSIDGNIRAFSRTAFSRNNHGTIIWKGVTIWNDGEWTKEGRALYNKGEIHTTLDLIK